MRYAAGIHEPEVFVIYTTDTPSYAKIVFSVAEQDALMFALLTHWRENGRDVALTERFPTEPEDA